MKSTLHKKFESGGKRLLLYLSRRLLYQKKKQPLSLRNIHKILVFRLDQRVGNGMMLLPLLRAIRHSLPEVQLHLLLHQPVSNVYQKYSAGLIDRYWPYRQDKLLTDPVRFFSWLKLLRLQKYDLVISSHNPDNFSISQLLLGWWCRPKALLGFSWEMSSVYYDIAVRSSSDKHYALSQLDLWKYFDPAAELLWGGLQVPPKEIQKVLTANRLSSAELSVLLWLGATGQKVLPADLIQSLWDELSGYQKVKILPAFGPNDRKILPYLPPEIQKKVLIWEHPLAETMAFFAGQKVFISGDTGPAHLAAALGLPMLTIFVNSKKEQYGYHDGRLRFALTYDGLENQRAEILKTIRILIQAITHESKK
jgi:ADP-heptose:LPS heptosyltransferase